MPTSTTFAITPVPLERRADGALVKAVVLADGAFSFSAPSRAELPRMRQRDALAVAKLVAPARAKRTEPDLFFAILSVKTPVKAAEVGASFDRRPVWVAVFKDLESERADLAEIRPRPVKGSTTLVATTTSTTLAVRTVRTDLLVVIDDRSKGVVIRSEFASTPFGPSIPKS